MTEADLIAAAKRYEDEQGPARFADLWLDIFTAFEQRTGIVFEPAADDDECEIVSLH